MIIILLAAQLATLPVAGCSPPAARQAAAFAPAERRAPAAAYRSVGEITLGEPLAVAVDFQGAMFIADGIPGRIVQFDADGSGSREFQNPASSPGFYPSDCTLQGFSLYAVDEVTRTIHRFDKEGAYRDLLLAFTDELIGGGRVSPCGLDVESSGRIAVTDIENHRVLLYDAYLSLELVFGSYGSFEGQFDSPRGISFTHDNRLLVSDTGNGRVLLFDDTGTYLRSIPPADGVNPLVQPRRAVMATDGTVYVADPAAGAVVVFAGDGVEHSRIVPNGTDRFEPTDVAIVNDRVLYVTDAAANTLYIFKVM